MEFKGTKGKWFIKDKQASIIDDKGQSVICWYGVATSTFEADEIKLKSNSLLISKAPEMLELLNNINEALKMGLSINKDMFTHKQIQELIKEATEM